jgi:segregation and condensation protein A
MAATLMAIKSRSLLPRDEVDLEKDLDPRDELIQRLIEYRRFKINSRDLGERFDERAKLHPHGWHEATPDEPTLDFGELTQWDLLAAFSRLMRETLAHRPLEIHTDGQPLRWYVEQLVLAIKQKKRFSLGELVQGAAGEPGASRAALIGSFCALLELMKLGVVSAHQKRVEDDILIVLREDLEQDIDDIVRLSGFEDEEERIQRSNSAGPAAAEEHAVSENASDEEHAS